MKDRNLKSNKGRPGIVRTAKLYSEWVKMVMFDKMKSDDVIKALSEKYAIDFKRMRDIAYQEKWYELSLDLLPAGRALEPTSTTALEVLDMERRSFLEAARKALIEWNKGMDYFAGKFAEAKENRNFIMASEALQEMSKLSLMLTRIQSVSQGATCDGGSATAITETSGSVTNNAIILQMSPLMAKARIPQPGARAIEFQAVPAEGEPSRK